MIGYGDCWFLFDAFAVDHRDHRGCIKRFFGLITTGRDDRLVELYDLTGHHYVERCSLPISNTDDRVHARLMAQQPDSYRIGTRWHVDCAIHAIGAGDCSVTQARPHLQLHLSIHERLAADRVSHPAGEDAGLSVGLGRG